MTRVSWISKFVWSYLTVEQFDEKRHLLQYRSWDQFREFDQKGGDRLWALAIVVIELLTTKIPNEASASSHKRSTLEFHP